MKDCEYYKTYRGPELVKATIGDINVFEIINKLYGERRDWNGYIYDTNYLKSLIEDDIDNKTLYMEFRRSNGRTDWTKALIEENNIIWNGPMFTPLSDNS